MGTGSQRSTGGLGVGGTEEQVRGGQRRGVKSVDRERRSRRRRVSRAEGR